MTRLSLTKAFLSYPKIVLLDEPTASLDPDIAQEVRDFILEQRKDFNVSIILTSHNMSEVSDICDRVLVLQHGKIIAEDTPHKLASKIALTQVILRITNRSEAAVIYLRDQNFMYSDDEGLFSIEVEEPQIASLLISLSKLGVDYSHIEIKKPSLENYFLYIAQQGSKKSRNS